jgi:cobalt-zinc-cadmium resistance protein CzcA
MLDKTIAFSIKNKFIVGICTLALIAWGSWSATKVSIDAVPDITNNQVQVITSCPTLAGQEVEQLVTYPIEQSVANLPGLIELRSISRFGLSVITIVFNDEVDIYFARQLILERLNEARDKIPSGAGTPELAPVSTGLGEVYQYIIHPKKGSENKYTATELRTLQDWVVARQLYGTPGLAEVNSFGGRLKQYEVVLNPGRLLAMNVTIPEVFTALEKNNENTGGAYIDKRPKAYFIRGIGLISSFEDIKNIVVKANPNGIPILVKDVGEVQFGGAVRYGAMTFNGEVDAVGGIVMMLKGANSAEVVERVKAKMQTIQKSLPADIVIEPFLDRTDLINRAIHTVKTNLVEGALIVIFVLVLFLGNFRAGLIVASAIPIAMLFALGMMNLFGVSANLMSLGAIDFGLIVDGAVIIVEATMHHLSTRTGDGILTRDQMDKEVYNAASRIRNSAAFGEIIILIVYLPILTLAGIEGKMFRPMAQTVSFAIIGAFILSLTYIPMMSALFLSRKLSHKKTISDRMMDFFQKIYEPLLNKAIRLRLLVTGLTITVFLVSVVLFANMGGEFIPTLQEGDFAFHCILPQGTSLSQSIETSMQASRIAKQFAEVKMVVGKTGSAEVPTDPMPPEATDMMIILKQPRDWKRDITYDELAEELEHELSVIPGVFFEKNQPIQMRFNELMTGIRQDVAVKIFGENMDTLLTYAEQVSRVIQKTEGATEPMVERVEGLPQIVIRYNRSQIAGYGLNIEDINHIVSTAFAGGKAGVVFENERRFDLVVRLDSNSRSSMDDLEQLFIPTPSGAQIPLSQVAEIKMELGPAQISREDGKRRIVIGFNVRNRDVESVVTEIQDKLNNGVQLPEGYYFTYGGTFENLKAASGRLMIAVPVALGLIFLLLYFTFLSVKQAMLIYTAIPMAAIGGVFALMLRGMPFSISAGVGFIALFGVAVLNGIVLISTFNQLEEEGISDIFERVRQGTKMRLRPVLMTATVASLGFFPMAFSQGAGAEVQKPLATVVIGGLVSATFLTLFVLPLLYIFFSTGKIKVSRTAVILAIGLILSSQAQAQGTTLGVDEMIDLAIKNNPAVQAEDLNLQSARALQKSVFELPKTNVSVQYGQYNSINNDLGFQISQDIPFPTTYTAKAGLYKAQVQSSQLKKQVTVNELKARTKSLYYQYQFLLQNKLVLQQLDSAYGNFANAAALRYNTGESNLLEKTTAQAKQGQLKIALTQNETDIAVTYNLLKALINLTGDFTIRPASVYEPLTFDGELDTVKLNSNPSLQLLYQNVALAQQNKKVEAALALPDLSVGYFNQSLTGTQNINGNDIYFDRSKRFQGLSAGISVPLAFPGSMFKVKSLELQKQAVQKEADNTKLLLQSELQGAISEYQQRLTEYAFYKEINLNNADVILNTASLNYRSGNIAYMEYLQALQTAGEIRLGYLQAINRLNQSVININLLINQ